jgi:hypothetical protein
MRFAIRLVVAAAVAAAVAMLIGTPEVITLLIMFLPTFGITFWALGFLLKRDS